MMLLFLILYNLISSPFNEFTFKLFKKVNEIEGDTNVVISPLSVSVALGMLLNGARDSTEKAIKNVLGFSNLKKDEINKIYRELKDSLLKRDSAITMDVANSIWYRKGFKVKKKFIEVNKKYFDAEIRDLDFTKKWAKDTINNWVKRKTRGKIEKIVDTIKPLDVMFLINAVYFKGLWAYKFDKEKTYIDTFYTPEGKMLCYMMKREITCKYFSDDKFSAIILPYGKKDKERFEMMIILPHEKINVDDIILLFNPQKWQDLLKKFKDREVEVHLPKFKIKCKYELNDVLKALDMKIAFSRILANFRDITDEQIWIDRVKHATFIRVDEEGTEAVAATSVVLEKRVIHRIPILFHVNRPFIFVIFDKYTKTILFIGKVMYPVWKEDRG